MDYGLPCQNLARHCRAFVFGFVRTEKMESGALRLVRFQATPVLPLTHLLCACLCEPEPITASEYLTPLFFWLNRGYAT